jgi:hypothetical protein
MAGVMQAIRAEDANVKPLALTATIWLMGLPVLTIAAAMAVLFECTPLLNGGVGNVVFFCLWLAALVSVLAGPVDQHTGLFRTSNDYIGFTRAMAHIQQQVLTLDPDADVGSGLVMTGREIERTFVWHGLDWNTEFVLERVMWVGMAVALVLGSAIPFDRFDPARRRLKPEKVGLFRRLLEKTATIRSAAPLRRKYRETSEPQITAASRLTPLATTTYRVRFFRVLAAELKLMLRGHHWAWYLGSLGLIIAWLVSPPDELMQRVLLLVAWVWPVLVWSQMGVRERRYGTGQMVFSVPRPVLRQIPALWLAGVLFTLIMGSGALLRFALMGEFARLMAWCVGALFTPALALALGVLCGSARAFEVVYLLWWYIGLANRMPAFDYAGATAGCLARGTPAAYLGITVGLIVLALIGRRRQVKV